MTAFLHRLGRAAVEHRRRVLLAWLLVAIAAIALGRTAGGDWVEAVSIPGTESQRTADLLTERFPSQSGSTATVVFRAQSGSIREKADAIGMAKRRLTRLALVVTVSDPFREHAVSPDGSTAYATVRYVVDEREIPRGALSALERAVAPARAAGLRVELGGPVVQAAGRPETGRSELIGLAAAALVLLVAFGSLVAAGLPIATAVLGVGTGLALVSLLAGALELSSSARTIATMIGLGVSVDYALFVLSRHRQNLAEGMTVGEAAARAAATAGRAVVFAGGVVVVAILGLAATGIPAAASAGYATAVVVLCAVVAAVTLLPALLGLAGGRIGGVRDRRGGGWARWAARVARRPWRYAVASLVLLLLLAVPALDMRLALADAGTHPRSAPERRAYDLLAAGFGKGFNGPLTVAVELPQPHDRQALTPIVAGARADADVAQVAPPRLNGTGDTAVVTIVPRSAPHEEETSRLVHRLRDSILPKATAGTEATAVVGGPTAGFIDLSDRVQSRLLPFIGAIVGVSFLLLLLVFRSPVAALTAAVVNMLSIGAAYGVVVAIFQWGWGKQLVGLEQTVPIVPWVPMLMFAILFGLSMDYEVFLLSRIREAYVDTLDNLASVAAGLAATARVITSAALVMIAVFLSFVPSSTPIVKMMGVGLAVAVLVDATVVRVVLVPAVMALLRDANWWLPSRPARRRPVARPRS